MAILDGEQRKLDLFKEKGMGDGDLQGERLHIPEPWGLGWMMAAPRSWSFVLICLHWRTAFVLSEFWGVGWWVWVCRNVNE